jgi:hypothetical protein
LIKETADAGNGTYSLAIDVAELPNQVINALKKATQPCINDCFWLWGNNTDYIGNLY